jgi:hypothetical protein
MKTTKKPKKLNNWAEVAKFLKKKPITKAEKIDYLSNKFDEEEWTW